MFNLREDAILNDESRRRRTPWKHEPLYLNFGQTSRKHSEAEFPQQPTESVSGLEHSSFVVNETSSRRAPENKAGRAPKDPSASWAFWASRQNEPRPGEDGPAEGEQRQKRSLLHEQCVGGSLGLLLGGSVLCCPSVSTHAARTRACSPMEGLPQRPTFPSG